MTSKLSKFVAAGALAAIVAGASAPAFAADRTQSALLGAAIGAIAGTALGHGDTGAVLAGAAVGGVIGASTANNHRYSGGYRSYAPTYERSAYFRPAYRGYDSSYYAPVYTHPARGYYAPAYETPVRYRAW